MIKIVVALFIFLLNAPIFLAACDFDEGVKQYKKGMYQKALYLFDNSCQNGNRQGCYNLAVMYKHGQGIRPSRQKSEELFSMACQNGTKECSFSKLNNES